MDIAQLAIQIDTTQLKSAEKGMATAGAAAKQMGASVAGAADRASKEFKTFGRAANMAGRDIGVASAATESLLARVGRSQGIRAVSLQLSQVGQQAAVTGNALGALAIQLPDILIGFGTFGALAGVAAGALIPLFNRLGEGRNIAKQLGEEVDSLADAAQRYADNAAKAAQPTKDLEAEFGRAAFRARELFVALSDLDRLAALDQLRDTVGLISTTFGDVAEASRSEFEQVGVQIDAIDASIARLSENSRNATAGRAAAITSEILVLQTQKEQLGAVGDTVQRLAREFGISAQEAGKLAGALAQARNADTFGESAVALQNVQRLLREAVGDTSRLTAEQRAFLRATIEAELATRRVVQTSAELPPSIRVASGEASVLEQTMSRIPGMIAAGIGSANELAVALSGAAAAAVQLSNAVATVAGWLPGVGSALGELASQTTVVGKVASSVGTFVGKVFNSDVIDSAASSLQKYGKSISTIGSSLIRNQRAADAMAKSVGGGGGGGGGAKGAVEELTEAQKAAKKAAEDYANSLSGTVASAVDGFAASIGDLVTGGIEDFEDFGKRAVDIFKRMLAELISLAVSNPIKVALGLIPGAGGAGAGIAQAGSGLLGSFGSGLQSVLKGFTDGGFGGAFGAIGTALKGVSGGGLAGIGTALGAVAVPVAAIAAAVSFFQTKTTELDRGLRVTIGNMGTLVESFSKVEKSRFWGLSKTTKTTYDKLGEAAAAPIVRAVQIMQENVIGMAAAVGVGAEAFDDFAFRIKLSTKDRSAQEAVEVALKGAADAMAELAFAGTEGAEDLVAIMKVEKELAAVRAASARAVAASGLTNPNQGPGNVEATRSPEYRAYKSALDEVTSEFDEQIRSLTGQLETLRRTESIYIRDGETASEALTRLSSALTTVNAQFDFMGRALFDVSIAAADMASQLVDLFGTAEDFAVATTRYIELFYSEQERGRLITRSLTEQLMAFNVALPQSRRGLRDLVDGLDLTTDYGRQLYATLIQNADAFDTILPKVENLSIVLQRAFDFAAPLLSEAIAQSNESARAFQQSAQLWYRTADTLRGFIADLRGTDLGGLSGAAQLEFNRRQFEQAAAAARAGDQDAAASLPQLGRAFVESARAQSQTAEQFRAVAAQVASESQLVAGIATLEGAIDTVISDLFTQNSEALQGLADAIEQGGDVEAALEEFGPRIDDLAAAIAGLQELSYDGIRDALDSITVDLRTRDDIPRYLRDVITGEADNLTKTLDFIIRRDDLTPEQVFIAANTLSNLTKSVAFVVSERGLTDKVVELALATSGDIRRGLIFAVEKPLPEPLQTFALTSFDTLSRAVLLTLSSDSSNAAKRIALEGLGDYTATVRLAMRPESEASERVRRIVFRQAGTYTAGIVAALESNKLSERERRILLRQQGDYVANIRGIIKDERGATERLLLKKNTEGFREITLSAVYKDGLGAWTDFIRGKSDGKVQLGGRITFDPTQAFQDALSSGISEPFDLATKAMERLEKALAKDADLQDEANKYLRLSTLQQRRDAVLSEAQQTIDAIRALEAEYSKYGLKLINNDTGRDARLGITGDGLLDVERNRAIGYISPITPDSVINEFRGKLLPFLETLDSFFGIPKGLNNAIGRVSASLGIPGFGAGGDHAGGLRVVGEYGPELEATGPSRIYSNSDMRKIMSGDPRMMQRLLEAIEAMRREQRQLATQIAQNTSRTSRTLQTWDADGLPAERVDA